MEKGREDFGREIRKAVVAAALLLGAGCNQPLDTEARADAPRRVATEASSSPRPEGVSALAGKAGYRNEVIESRAKAAPFEPLLLVASSPASIGFVEMASRPIEDGGFSPRKEDAGKRIFLVRELDSSELIEVEAEITPEAMEF